MEAEDPRTLISRWVRVEPMLAETAEDPFDDPGWTCQLKVDGVRCIAFLGHQTRLQGRPGNSLTQKFPELEELHKRVSKPCILDGEIAGEDFAATQSRAHKERPLDITIAARFYPVRYFAFDILNLDGADLTHLPLEKRREALAAAAGPFLLPYYPGERCTELFQQVRQREGEGVMMKRLASTYQMGKRSRDWLKVKCFQEEVFTVYGATVGEKGRPFASLILGRDGHYVGNVGSGFTQEQLTELLARLRALARLTPAFAEAPDVGRDVLLWTEPVMQVEVRYLELGSDGKLRFPSFRRVM